MAEEIQEAVQIIRVAYDGIEIAMKVGSGGIAAMQKAIDFLKGMLDYEKSLGKTSMRKLILKGGDLQRKRKTLLSSSHSEVAARKTRFLLLKLWHIQRIRLSRTILWSHTGLNMI